MKTNEKNTANAQDFEKVTFRTTDGFVIAANLFRAGKDAVIMLHQFKLGKSSYTFLAKKLKAKKYTSLALDFRGHGESLQRNGSGRPYANFSDADFKDMIKDVQAAYDFLIKEGFNPSIIIGSSIGANTALNFAAQNGNVKKIIMLSPGLNYKGIETQESAPKVNADVLIVSSREDEYSDFSSETLEEQILNCEFRQMANAGHGTYMFNETDLEDELVDWIG